MPINLPALVTRFLTPETIGRIASALGIDRNIAQTAVNAAVPSLLAGLGNVAAQPGGPQRLANAAAQQTGTLENFASMLGATSQSPFIERGSNMLSSLLGSRGQTALVGAISKFTGIGENAATPLLGMLTPVVMHTIAQQQGATGALDPNKISSLLASQKDNIAAAMPAGLGNLLSGTGLLDSLGGATRMATAAGSEAARASVVAARDVTDASRRVAASASRNWAYWVIPAAAVAALLLYLVGRPTEQVVPPSTTGVAAGATDVGKQVTDSIGDLRSTLAGIADAASAQAALPKLRQTAEQLDKVNDMRDRLSADQRKIVGGVVTPAMSSLNQMFDTVLALPGISNELKPAIDVLRTKLSGLAAA
jgi:hypothetical protein